MSPAKPGTPAFIRAADPEKAGFFPYLDDRLGAPQYAFPLYSDEKEDDDDLHMPMWDDDVKFKPRFRDHFTRENIVSTFGLVFMVSGLLLVFVVLPVVSYTGTSLFSYPYDTTLDNMIVFGKPEPWATVNNKKYPLMSNLRTGLIDPDTPSSASTRKGVNGDIYKLVFSDEFNDNNRTFYPGDDPFWFGFEGWYGATGDMEWYDPDAIYTGGGTLQIQLDKFHNHDLDYRSGMINSWNKLCFKGGIFEVSVSLPGPAGVHGWWPGIWTMGNLGRPGYLATTDGLWPYTYNSCDVGITPNQSSTDGINYLPGQRLAACTCKDEDHPTPGTGRGAPEIDIAEVSADWGGKGHSVATQSFQVAPFDPWWYPNYEFMETPDYSLSFVNTYTGGPYQQAVSTTTMLNNEWYDGKAYQKFAYEYVPGDDKNSFIAWTIGEQEMMKFDARAIGPNGNIGQRYISEEPMSIIMNLGFSTSWVSVDWGKLVFPTVMRVDHVRWYQKEGEETVTCDPPGFETTEYIANHPEPYNNPNLTRWWETPYKWPKNTLMNGCSA
ncbi:beta-glucan synthesis-associated [Teratosphaeria nubilosa]|uniref:Beta-glucan synthesis-associated n=1 Tax=Teratosphaeria nubilosa TaxID=161662 RepID=A0A6G1LGC0_9PEZI|nr:beta-glucan synthesis-associated [Teratosphaeria nubilosa]